MLVGRPKSTCLMKDTKPSNQQAWLDSPAICPPTIHRIGILVNRRLPFSFNIIGQVNVLSELLSHYSTNPLSKKLASFLTDWIQLSTNYQVSSFEQALVVIGASSAGSPKAINMHMPIIHKIRSLIS